MSLKTFHVFFISVSVLLCLGFGWWCFTTDHGPYILGGIAALLCAVGLVVYEVSFLRKFKDMK